MLLQLGVPGGPELLVIVLVALLVFGIPLALVLVLGALWLRSDDGNYDDRIAQLEAEIETLRAEVENEESAGSGESDGPAEPGKNEDPDRDSEN